MVYIFQTKALVGKEQGTENCNGNKWEDTDETGDSEFLNSDESSLPVEAVVPSLSEIKPVLLKESNSQKQLLCKEIDDCPPDPHLSLPFCLLNLR